MVEDMVEDMDTLKRQLAELKTEHRDLDEVIKRIISSGEYDQLQVVRLKKRKLAVKDEIVRIEDLLLPDIIA